MSEVTAKEVQEAIEKVHKSFEDFKGENDSRLKEIEKKGHADPLLEKKVEKMSTAVGELDTSYKKMTDARETEEKEYKEKMEKLEADQKAWVDKIETVLNRGDVKEDKETGLIITPDMKEHHEAFMNGFLRKGRDESLSELEEKALSVGSEPDGGYVVPATTTQRIITKVFETSPIRQIAAVETIGTDRMTGLVDKDEAATGWVAEKASRTETDTPQLAQWEIPVHEQYAEPRVTQKLLDDAQFNIENWLQNKVADKLARTENTAFVAGNGTGKPRGFTDYTTVATADSSRAWGSLEHVITGHATAFTASDPADPFISLVTALKAGYRTGATWVTGKLTLATIRKFKDGNGQYLWQPGIIAGQPTTILAYPILEAEDMPAMGANALSIAFGNFRQGYTIIDRIGIRVLRDPFTTKPFVKFYTTKRVGGGVVNFEAIKLMKHSA